MKTGDMVLQSELVARWADKKRLAFIGDGDAISVCVAYLQKRNILDYGPSKITVFDFDERICGAVNRFADKERLEQLGAQLYNCLDAFPTNRQFDCFYTNPPWGASNDGASVNVFAQRGMEAVGYTGDRCLGQACTRARTLFSNSRSILPFRPSCELDGKLYHDLQGSVVQPSTHGTKHWRTRLLSEPKRKSNYFRECALSEATKSQSKKQRGRGERPSIQNQVLGIQATSASRGKG